MSETRQELNAEEQAQVAALSPDDRRRFDRMWEEDETAALLWLFLEREDARGAFANGPRSYPIFGDDPDGAQLVVEKTGGVLTQRVVP